MNKRVFGIMALLFIVSAGLSVAGAVSAAQIDQGSIITQNGHKRVTWNTQSFGPNHVIIHKTTWRKVLLRQPWRKISTSVIRLQKITNRRLRITSTNPRFTRFVTTRLNAIQYYRIHKFALLRI